MTDEHFYTMIDMIRARLDRIDNRLSALEAQHNVMLLHYTRSTFVEELKATFIKNWWKILAILIPALFFLGELAVHIRTLV